MEQRSTGPVNRRAMPIWVGGAALAMVGAIFIFSGRPKGNSTATAPAPATKPAPLPEQAKEQRFTQWQRTTEVLPGVEGVQVSLGDVTGGKVKLSVSLDDGKTLVEQRALARGDDVKFEHEGRTYRLRIAELRNALLGNDEVVMVLSGAAPAQTQPAALSEEQKIERLIQAVSDLDGAVFIRNGGEHSAADAVAHMRRKWESGKEKIRTARDFITHAGARSSLSGEPYRIRMKDGREVTSEAFLTKKLAELEGKGAA